MNQLLTMLSMLGLLGGLYLFLGPKKPKSKSVELYGTNSFTEDDRFLDCVDIMNNSDNRNNPSNPLSHYEFDAITDDFSSDDMFDDAIGGAFDDMFDHNLYDDGMSFSDDF